MHTPVELMMQHTTILFTICCLPKITKHWPVIVKNIVSENAWQLSESKSANGGDWTIQITLYEDGVSRHTLAPCLELSDPRFALVRTASPTSFYGPTESDINTTNMHLASWFGVRGEVDPYGFSVVIDNLCSVNVQIGVHCGQQSWGLRGPDWSFTTFCAGVVRNLGGVGGRAEQLSSSLVMLLVPDCSRPGVRHFCIGACWGRLAHSRLLVDCHSAEGAEPEPDGCSVVVDSLLLVREQWRRGMLWMKNHPLDVCGWWHHSHIPMRGEEVCGGFSSLPGSAHDGCKPPPDLGVRRVRQLVEWFTSCLGHL